MSPRRALRALALAAIVAAPAAGLAQSTDVVAVDGVRREVPILERQGRRFVALEDVARLLGGAVTDSGGERAVLAVDGVDLLVLRRVPFVRYGDRWFQMTEPAQRDANGYWLPAASLHHLLPVLYPGRFPPAGEGPARALPSTGEPAPAGAEEPPQGGVESGMIGRAGVDVRVEPGRTRLGFRLGATPDVAVDAGAPGALQLRLAGAEVPAAMARGLRKVGLVDSVSVAPEPGGSVLTLWVDRRASMYSVAPLSAPRGVEVVLLATDPGAIRRLAAADLDRRDAAREAGRREAGRREAGRRSVGDAGSPPADAPTSPSVPPDRVAPSGGWSVVVDAGHGGHDPGAHGPGGTEEKDVTLAIARALRQRLEEGGAEVVMTRSDDTFVALGDRRMIANRSGADLFVSIHANAAENRAAEGFETYYLSTAKTAHALEVARRENASIRYENPEIDPESLDELNFILWDLAQNEFFRESSVLAETVQEAMDRRLSLKSRGVKQAPFYVLNGTFMPAILYETAFITNPREESLLNDPEFRNRLVDGLAGSILAYLDRYGRKVVSPQAAR